MDSIDDKGYAQLAQQQSHSEIAQLRGMVKQMQEEIKQLNTAVLRLQLNASVERERSK